MNAIGISAGKIPNKTPNTGDLCQPQIAGPASRLTKMPYIKSLAKMFAHRRTVSDSKRAAVLINSTGNSRIARRPIRHSLRRARKRYKISNRPMMAHALPVEVQERNQRTSQRYANRRGRRFQNGKAPNIFASKTKIERLPTTGIYLSQSCPAFSSSTSVMPNPSGLVRSNSAICCEAPGRSTDKRERTHKAKIVPTNRTSRPITTCSGIGKLGFSGRMCKRKAAPAPRRQSVHSPTE